MKLLALVLIIASDTLAQSTPAVSDVLILDRTLSQGYDWRIRPRPVGPRGVPVDGPTNISANLYIRRLKLVDDLLDLEVTFRQSWNDHRLGYSRDFRDGPPFVNIHPLEKTERRIWTPDTFFQNAYDVQMQHLPSPNELTRVYNDGNVLTSQKVSFKAPCVMDFRKYPHDTQKCTVDFASYAHTTTDAVYSWKTDLPIQLKDGLGQSIPDFELVDVKTENTLSKTSAGEYSGLRVIFTLKRTSASLSLKLYFIPLLLALLSLLPMILNAQSIVVRVLIGFFCLATLILHWSIIGQTLPRSGHSGAEVWLTRCLFFIAATLVQLIFYVWITRANSAHKERKLAKLRVAKERRILTQTDGILEDTLLLLPTEQVLPERKMSLSLLVDMISLGIFLLAFLVFLIHYFSTY